MERVEEVYTLAEIAMATGINQGTLASRRKRLGIQADRGGTPWNRQSSSLRSRPGNARQTRAQRSG